MPTHTPRRRGPGLGVLNSSSSSSTGGASTPRPPAMAASGADPGHIAFFVAAEFHRPMLEPIYAGLEAEFRCLLSDDMESIFRFAPRIVVQAEGDYYSQFRERLPNTLMVFTRHGFSSKNFARSAIADSDYTCVSSEWVRDDCTRRGWIPRLGYWITGFPPMDSVLRSTSAPRRTLLPDSFLREGPTILWAPTYDRLLSSVEVLGPDWIDDLRHLWPDVNLIIKPHPHTPESNPEWMTVFRDLDQRSPRTLLVENPHANLYDYLSLADILLTDVSSVMFYFLALDRPIILVSNPKRASEPLHFDPEGPEWTWRDMGIDIARREDLAAAVRRCLEKPAENAEQRAFYRDRVFGDLLDGRASDRIADRLRQLLRPTPDDRAWVDVTWNSLGALAVLHEENLRLGRHLSELERLRSLLPLTRWSRELDRFPFVKRALKRVLTPGKAKRLSAGP